MAHPQDHTQESLQGGLLLRPTASPDEHDTRSKGVSTEFLFRARKLKEKLMRKASDDDAGEGGEQFGPELIQRKILVFTVMRFQLKLYLSNRTVTDEVLIERISEAANLEQERQQKLRKKVQAEPYPPDA